MSPYTDRVWGHPPQPEPTTSDPRFLSAIIFSVGMLVGAIVFTVGMVVGAWSAHWWVG